MLKSLQIGNWKSFGQARNTLELAPLTLIVGPNASGKSNALDALRFLQGAALEYPLGDVLRGRWQGQREIWPPIRGQVAEATRGGTTRFGLVSDWALETGGGVLRHAIEVDVQGDASLFRESVFRDGSPLFDTHGASLGAATGPLVGGAINAALKSRGKGKSQKETYSALSSLLGQVTASGRVDADAIAKVHELQRAIRSTVFLDIQPSRMRDYRPERPSSLGTSGENISPVLAALPDDARQDIVDWLSELCAPEVRDLEFDRTQLREVMLFVREGDFKISARSLSDGTLRFLGLVTALLTAPEGSLLVLEEPDVGLHPARVHLLARLLEQTSRTRNVQVIATTHSPTLLAHLSIDSLRDVVAMGRDEHGATVCSRLGKLEYFETLEDSRQLEHLVSTGWIERAL